MPYITCTKNNLEYWQPLISQIFSAMRGGYGQRGGFGQQRGGYNQQRGDFRGGNRRPSLSFDEDDDDDDRPRRPTNNRW
jgi:hypothetical protein